MGVGEGDVVAVSKEKKGRGIELLGAEDVAGLLGVKESTVWRWCRVGTAVPQGGQALAGAAGGLGRFFE